MADACAALGAGAAITQNSQQPKANAAEKIPANRIQRRPKCHRIGAKAKAISPRASNLPRNVIETPSNAAAPNTTSGAINTAHSQMSERRISERPNCPPDFTTERYVGHFGSGTILKLSLYATNPGPLNLKITIQ